MMFMDILYSEVVHRWVNSFTVNILKVCSDKCRCHYPCKLKREGVRVLSKWHFNFSNDQWTTGIVYCWQRWKLFCMYMWLKLVHTIPILVEEHLDLVAFLFFFFTVLQNNLPVVGPPAQINWILTSVPEVYRVWSLATNYHGAYFLSLLQTSSLLQAPIQVGLAPDCVEETYFINIYFLPSNCDRQYYSKWLHFVLPHATRPTYRQIPCIKCYKICKKELFLLCVMDALFCSRCCTFDKLLRNTMQYFHLILVYQTLSYNLSVHGLWLVWWFIITGRAWASSILTYLSLHKAEFVMHK